MTFLWNAKNNFILLHSINLHQQESLTSDINWLVIVNDIRLDICSTPTLLKKQYEHLLEAFYPKQDSKSLFSTLKRIYLRSLCQKIEDDLELTLLAIYEIVRHARAKRIYAEDFIQLQKEWNFDYSTDDQKESKDRLFKILTRLCDYTYALFNKDCKSIQHYSSKRSNPNGSSIVDKDEMPVISLSENELMNVDYNHIVSNGIDQEKSSSSIRRRSQSLTFFMDNKNNKVNIGVEWFVPELKRQQRSSSLHARSQSPVVTDSSSSQNQNLGSIDILLTTIDNDESSNSTSNSDRRQTLDKEHEQSESKLIDNEQLDEVSSDSDAIKIQWSPVPNNKVSESRRHRTTSSSSQDFHHSHRQHEQNSCKRQRLS